ncbi:MAG: GNAT family N-acetyltransferase [Firmicutes bacterium]|nr:GNAT family N-acetyltransferase [Bacillota bacterium]
MLRIFIRPAQLEDSLNLGNLHQVLFEETSFMLMEPDELPRDAEFWEHRMASFLNDSKNGFWVAQNERGMLVGFLRMHGNSSLRLAHSAQIVLGVKRSYWGQGIGTHLFETGEQWAKTHGLVRLELTVMVPNRRALGLYHKMGFVVEGLRRQSIRYSHGEYVDEYLMAKILSP